MIPVPRYPVTVLLATVAVGLSWCAAFWASTAMAQQVAAPVPGLHDGAVASSASTARERAVSRLDLSVREFRRSADRSVAEPANAIWRIGFSANAALLKAAIRGARAAGGLAREADVAQLVLDQQSRRVHAAWNRVDDQAQIAAAVRLINSLTVDAARRSGARTNAELNAFKRAHIKDVSYASRRWLGDRQVGRQGAVIIARGVRNARLRRAVEQLYRYGAKTGDGGTADKLLAEVKASCRRAGCAHFKKAEERRTLLLKILSEERLSATERGIAGELVGALTKAIRTAGGK